DNTRRNVILRLDLHRRREVLADFVGAPGVIPAQTNAQVRTHELSRAELQLVPRESVHLIHTKMLAPIVSPFGMIETLDDEDDGIDVARDRRQPFVVLI